MKYVIREVDGCDADISQALEYLHDATFLKEAPPINTEDGHWWIAYCAGRAVAFAGLSESERYPNHGYFNRVGVLKPHRGRGLQARFMRAIESRAKRNGWLGIVSDTTNGNVSSANNFVKRGYRVFWPKHPWSFPYSIYWQKRFTRESE